MKLNLPQAFIEFVRPQLGDTTDDFITSLETTSPTSIRINKAKSSKTYEEQVPWCEFGYYLPERPSFIADPLFHAGYYYPQEASSMFLYEIMKQLPLPEQPIVLDLCAAPGGKSTLLLSFLDHKGLLVSNEVIRSRAEILNENITKWGYSNVVVTNNDPKDFSRSKVQFDVAVVDAPCSGEGMFRKDNNAIREWSEENVMLCTGRQKRILSDIESSIKPGGYLIYSTCTYNQKEDEENISWLVNEHGYKVVNINCQSFKGITKNMWGMKFFPHKTKGEGFFISVLQKEGEYSERHLKKQKKERLLPVKQNETAQLSNWIIPQEGNNIYQKDDQIILLPINFKDVIEELLTSLNVIKSGINIAEITKKGINPTHDLALSLSLNKEVFPTIEVSLEDAIKFLRKDNIFNSSAPTGFNLITYENAPLGWVKNIGNRMNNYYPKHWRIRKEIEFD